MPIGPARKFPDEGFTGFKLLKRDLEAFGCVLYANVLSEARLKAKYSWPQDNTARVLANCKEVEAV